jgi:hypothetical protein
MGRLIIHLLPGDGVSKTNGGEVGEATVSITDVAGCKNKNLL